MRKGITVSILAVMLAATPARGGGQATSVAANDPPEEVLLSDAVAYADLHGVSVAEATRRLSLQGAVGRLDEMLEASLPNRFAGLWIDNGPDYRVVVRLTAGPSLDFAN